MYNRYLVFGIIELNRLSSRELDLILRDLSTSKPKSSTFLTGIAYNSFLLLLLPFFLRLRDLLFYTKDTVADLRLLLLSLLLNLGSDMKRAFDSGSNMSVVVGSARCYRSLLILWLRYTTFLILEVA